jgi:hypothetical protein
VSFILLLRHKSIIKLIDNFDKNIRVFLGDMKINIYFCHRKTITTIKAIVTMKGTIKEMIYCRTRFGAMLRRREVQQSLDTGFGLAFLRSLR